MKTIKSSLDYRIKKIYDITRNIHSNDTSDSDLDDLVPKLRDLNPPSIQIIRDSKFNKRGSKLNPFSSTVAKKDLKSPLPPKKKSDKIKKSKRKYASIHNNAVSQATSIPPSLKPKPGNKMSSSKKLGGLQAKFGNKRRSGSGQGTNSKFKKRDSWNFGARQTVHDVSKTYIIIIFSYQC